MNTKSIHELALVFPAMNDEEYSTLKESIKANGLKTPIWLFEGQIIDGRNRYKACLEVGVEPTFQEYSGDNAIEFVRINNLHRRDLSSSQRALAIVELNGFAVKQQAKLRQIDNGKLTGLRNKKDMENFPSPSNDEYCEPIKITPSSARKALADQGKTNEKYVDTASKIIESHPELKDKVRAGALNMDDAKQLVQFKESSPDLFAKTLARMEEAPNERVRNVIRAVKNEQISKNNAEMIPTDKKYRVIYADPPWSYGCSVPDTVKTPEDYYPAMSTEDICAMPIKEIAEANSVLFMWTTSPHLEESFSVIKAWGFEYKTSFVWDKVKHNMGHYNSVRHEFLLVATRGSCTPDVKKLFDSVITEERSEHSKKPQQFYTIIETLYTHGEKIELFCRTCWHGWDVFGNQSKDKAANDE